MLDESEEKNNQKNIGPSLPNKLLPTVLFNLFNLNLNY